MDSYDFMAGARELSVFVDQVSNWYIRRSRERFWREGLSDDKVAAFHTLHEVLVKTSQLIAPFTPFIAEDIHSHLIGESVHLADFPKPDPRAVNTKLETEMIRVRQVIEMARNIRNTKSIKTKQPLSELTIVGTKQNTDKLLNHSSIIKEELNVKKVFFQEHAGLAVQYEIKLNFRTAGPKFGKHVGAIQKELQSLTVEEAEKVASLGYFITTALPSDKSCVEKADLIINQKSQQGVEMTSDETYAVFLNTEITDDLRKEGLARELIRAVQQYRKELNLPVEKRVHLTFDVSEKIKQVILQFNELLQSNLLRKRQTVPTYQFKFNDGIISLSYEAKEVF